MAPRSPRRQGRRRRRLRGRGGLAGLQAGPIVQGVIRGSVGERRRRQRWCRRDRPADDLRARALATAFPAKPPTWWSPRRGPPAGSAARPRPRRRRRRNLPAGSKGSSGLTVLPARSARPGSSLPRRARRWRARPARLGSGKSPTRAFEGSVGRAHQGFHRYFSCRGGPPAGRAARSRPRSAGRRAPVLAGKAHHLHLLDREEVGGPGLDADAGRSVPTVKSFRLVA